MNRALTDEPERDPSRRPIAPRYSPMWQLVMARLREFLREPEAVFWVYGFPIVMVVALGIACAVVAVAANRHLAEPGGGWFAYAPDTGPIFEPGGAWPIWREAIVWLAALGVWSSISLRVLRSADT